jgi:hypothetical protein
VPPLICSHAVQQHRSIQEWCDDTAGCPSCIAGFMTHNGGLEKKAALARIEDFNKVRYIKI